MKTWKLEDTRRSFFRKTPTDHTTTQRELWECHDSLSATSCTIWQLHTSSGIICWSQPSRSSLIRISWLTWKPRWSRQLQTSSVIICCSQPSGSSQMGLIIPWFATLGAVVLQWAVKLSDFEYDTQMDSDVDSDRSPIIVQSWQVYV